MPIPPGIRASVIRSTLALVFVSLASPDGGAQSVSALLSQFRGDVKVRKVGEEAELPARVGLRLAEGDAVDVARGSRAVLLFNNGRLVTATTSLVVAPVGGAGAAEIYQRASRTLTEAGAQGRPTTAGGIGRPPPAGAYPLEPAFGTRVASARPDFQWQGQDDAEGYLLQIRPTGGGGTPIRFQVTGPGPWTLPDSVPALQRGVEYAWTVVPLPGRRFGGEERFTVLDEEIVAELEAFHASLAEAGVDPQGDGLLVAAMFYADLGMIHEAAEALDALLASAGEDEVEPVVDLLHAQILERLGRTEEAVAAYERAQRER